MSVFTSGSITTSFTPVVSWDQLTLLEYEEDLMRRENMEAYYRDWKNVANSASSYTFEVKL